MCQRPFPFPSISTRLVATIAPIKMCFGSRDDAEAKRSREIDALIHRDEKIIQRQVKLLLLGERSYPLPAQRLGNHHADGQWLTHAI